MTEKSIGFSGTFLKWIAVLTMTIDHTAFALVKDRELYFWLRTIGRFAFPAYAFLLVEGHVHTRDHRRYLLRLGAFALISEIPFNLLEGRAVRYSGAQNVFFTLFLGALMLYLMKMADEQESHFLQFLTKVLLPIGFAALAEWSEMDYGMSGILLIYLLGILRPWKIEKMLFVTGVMAVCWRSVTIQMYAAFVPPIIYILYNGERGRTGKILQYIFYAYYPIHLLVLYGIQRCIL